MERQPHNQISAPPQGTVSVAEILSYLEQDRYLDMDELTHYLGLCKRKIRSLLPSIPCFRIGRQLRFRKSEIDRWVEQHRQQPADLDLHRLVEEAVTAVTGKK